MLGVDARLPQTLLRLRGGQIMQGQSRDPFNPRRAPDRKETGSEEVCAPWRLVRPRLLRESIAGANGICYKLIIVGAKTKARSLFRSKTHTQDMYTTVPRGPRPLGDA